MPQNLIFCWSKVGVKHVFHVNEGEWVRRKEKREGGWEIFLLNCLSESHSPEIYYLSGSL